MVTFPEEDIKTVNQLLHRLIGQDFIEDTQGETFLLRRVDDTVLEHISPQESLRQIKNLDDERFKELYRIVNFYHARWLAYIAIKDSDVEYAVFASDNELLLALTSIIDRLANKEKHRNGWTRRFVEFISTNLSPSDIRDLIDGPKVIQNGEEKGIGDLDFGRSSANLSDLEKFSKYVYEVRSIVVHNAELTGMHPWAFNFHFNVDSDGGWTTNSVQMIRPELFRKYLWKAILKSLGLDLIRY